MAAFSPQVLPALCHSKLKSPRELLRKPFEVGSLQTPPHILVRVVVEWIQVGTEGVGEQHWILPQMGNQFQEPISTYYLASTVHIHTLPVQPTHLWDDGDAGPEVVQTQGAHIHIINHYLPTNWFHDAEESKREGRLPSTSATYDANLHDTEQQGLD